MPVSKSSSRSPISETGGRNGAGRKIKRKARGKSPARGHSGVRHWITLLVAFVLLAAVAGTAASWFYRHGYLCYYGDAEAHLNHARRILDSRTPGPDQLGTPWLPLPHLLMVPFVAEMNLWQTGLAATIPGVACFV